MAKVSSNDAEAKDMLSRLGKKLPKGVKHQDRAASFPTKEQSAPVSKVKSKTTKHGASDSYGDNGESSPGGVMGHKSRPTPVKITAKTTDKRS